MKLARYRVLRSAVNRVTLVRLAPCLVATVARYAVRRVLGLAILAIAASVTAPVQACGLEVAINGGFTVSHPRSLEIAVAVAKARSTGALPAMDPDVPSNDVLLRQMIADLRRLQSRLNAGRVVIAKGKSAPFSLVLVGPGLWSHYHMTSGGVLARYHVDGPLDDKAVVLTHHSVLKALLQGTLTPEDALDQGLLAFSGDGTGTLSKTFSASLAPKA